VNLLRRLRRDGSKKKNPRVVHVSAQTRFLNIDSEVATLFRGANLRCVKDPNAATPHTPVPQRMDAPLPDAAPPAEKKRLGEPIVMITAYD